MIFKELETERLYLRKFNMNDAENMFHGWAKNLDNILYLNFHPHSDVKVTKKILSEWISEYDEQKDKITYAMELKDNEELIGSFDIRLYTAMENVRANIGYCISKKHWNHGLTTEAFKEVIRYCFEELNVHRIEATHDIENIGSGRVMEKSGLIREATLKSYAGNHANPRCDCAIWALTIEEYKQKGDNKNG